MEIIPEKKFKFRLISIPLILYGLFSVGILIYGYRTVLLELEWSFFDIVLAIIGMIYPFVCVIIAYASFYIDLFTDYRSGYEEAKEWQSDYEMCLIVSICCFFVTIPLSIVSYVFYRKARNKYMVCERCGNRLHLVPKEEKGDYLLPVQLSEINEKTMAYDVWVCEQCHTSIVQGFEMKTPPLETRVGEIGRYIHCPHCQGYTLKGTSIVPPKFFDRSRIGYMWYACMHCKKDYYRQFTQRTSLLNMGYTREWSDELTEYIPEATKTEE